FDLSGISNLTKIQRLRGQFPQFVKDITTVSSTNCLYYPTPYQFGFPRDARSPMSSYSSRKKGHLQFWAPKVYQVLTSCAPSSLGSGLWPLEGRLPFEY